MENSVYENLGIIQKYKLKYLNCKIYLSENKETNRDIFVELWKLGLILGFSPFKSSILNKYLFQGSGKNLFTLNDLKKDVEELLPIHRNLTKSLCKDFYTKCKKSIVYYYYSIYDDEEKVQSNLRQIDSLCSALNLHFNYNICKDLNFIESEGVFNYSCSINVPNLADIQSIKFFDIVDFSNALNMNIRKYYSTINIDRNNFN